MEWLNPTHTLLPQLLFLAFNMPRKHGLLCLKEIRSNDRLKEISIAIYSTSKSQKDMEKTFRNGANIDIHKSAYFNILKQVLEKAVITAYQYEQQRMNREFFLLRI